MSKNKMKNLKIEYTKSYIVKINRVLKKKQKQNKNWISQHLLNRIVYRYFAFLLVCTTCVYNVHARQNMALDLLELCLEMVVALYLGTGNRTWFLCKNSALNYWAISPALVVLFFVFFRLLTLDSLAWNSKQSFCFILLNAGVTSVRHSIQARNYLF